VDGAKGHRERVMIGRGCPRSQRMKLINGRSRLPG